MAAVSSSSTRRRARLTVVAVAAALSVASCGAAHNAVEPQAGAASRTPSVAATNQTATAPVDPAHTAPAHTAPAVTAPGATTPPATAPVGVAPEPLADVATVARAQRLLLARGIDIGEADGEAGPRTVAALAAFQAEAHLAPTGVLDRATLTALESASAEFVAKLPASVVVDLSDQRATVLNSSGGVVAAWPISTGGPGSETPTGSYAVQSRIRVGEAKDAPTVHMDYFTVFNDNIGFHGIPWVSTRDNRLWTPLGEYGVSHGCIRLEDVNAQFLYTYLPDGAHVTVVD